MYIWIDAFFLEVGILREFSDHRGKQNIHTHTHAYTQNAVPTVAMRGSSMTWGPVGLKPLVFGNVPSLLQPSKKVPSLPAELLSK